MRFTQTFTVASTPEVLFDYVTNPANLRAWQTSKTRVEPLSDGPPRAGYRLREWTKPPATREFEQVVEFTEFDRPHRLHVHVVEGPYRIDGTWTFVAEGATTRVEFLAEGELSGVTRLASPLFRRIMGRQFAIYHQNLCRNVESLG
jgi:uncharacterized protein YndB with AHSA1/START domain